MDNLKIQLKIYVLAVDKPVDNSVDNSKMDLHIVWNVLEFSARGKKEKAELFYSAFFLY